MVFTQTMTIRCACLQVKVKGARKIAFAEFESALQHIAQKKGHSVDEVMAKILESSGPNATATKADAVKFHDDKSLYTGAWHRICC